MGDEAIVEASANRASGSRRTAKHRKRLLEAGLVRIEGWVPQPLRKTAQDYLAALGKLGAGNIDSAELVSELSKTVGNVSGPGSQRAGEPVAVFADAAQLRPLPRREVTGRARREDEKVALIIDATSRPSQSDAVLEVAMVAVTYDRQERIGDLLWSLSVGYEPGPLIELLASADLKSLVKQSQIVIAHDAKVIRPLCETLSPEFAAAPWSCSATEIPWASVGAGSFDLDNLLLRNNWLNSGQRPIDRCHAILELLAAPFVSPDTMALSMLLATARVKQIRFWVDNVQTNIRDVLELHGYRPIEGAAGSNQWWHDVPAAAEEAERAFLQQVYQSDYEPRTEDVTARTRFRAPTIR